MAELLTEQKDTELLQKVAAGTVDRVMRRNAPLGKVGRWQKLNVFTMIEHAFDHLFGRPSREDLEHALVRLTMALAILGEAGELDWGMCPVKEDKP